MTTKVYDPRWDKNSKPAYVDYLDSYWLGLSGQEAVDNAKVCMDQKPYASKRGKTFEDFFLTLITIGIYSPTTIKIWCGD